MTHDELRQYYRKQRAGISQADLDKAAINLCERVIGLEEYQRARRIAGYFAVRGEISLDPVIDHALAHGKQIYLPSLEQQLLRFSTYFHSQKMRINQFKLPEPDVDNDDRLTADQLDLVLVPLVVFDAACHRIGMGGGFYDRSFAFRKQGIHQPILIGVAHDIQRVERLIPQDWDVRLDKVITDRAIYNN